MKNVEFKINEAKVKIHFLFSRKSLNELETFLEVMGFKNKKEFDGLLEKLVFFRDFEINIELIDNITNATKNVLNLCQNVLQDEEINIFFFETRDEFIANVMDGSSGFCTNKDCILVLLNVNKFTENGLKNTIAHELAHAISSYYDMGNMSVGEGIIFDGLAENFREVFIDKTKSKIVLQLKEEEIRNWFNKIKPILKSKNLKDYQEVFFGTGKYPLWLGYAIGYHIIKDNLSKINKLSWKKILRKDPNLILKSVIKD